MYISGSSSSGGAPLDWQAGANVGARTGFPSGEAGGWHALGASGGSISGGGEGGVMRAPDWPPLGSSAAARSPPPPPPFSRALSAPPDHGQPPDITAASASAYLAAAALQQDSRCVQSTRSLGAPDRLAIVPTSTTSTSIPPLPPSPSPLHTGAAAPTGTTHPTAPRAATGQRHRRRPHYPRCSARCPRPPGARHPGAAATTSSSSRRRRHRRSRSGTAPRRAPASTTSWR